MQIRKSLGLIKESDVDAAPICAVRDDIVVAEARKPGTVAEKMDHTVIFHLTKRDQVHRLQSAGGKNRFGERRLFMEVARCVPASFGSGEKLLIGEALIVQRVVEVFDVPLHRAESHGALLWSVEKSRLPLCKAGEHTATR